MSQALREAICIMQLVSEAKKMGIHVRGGDATTIKCKEIGSDIGAGTMPAECLMKSDSTGAIELAKVPKMRPRTKHINIKYHHFREHVKSGAIKVEYTNTKDQVADIFTKPLGQELFAKHCDQLLGEHEEKECDDVVQTSARTS